MRIRAARLLAAGWCCAAFAGCAGVWDDVTARNFDLQASLFPPDPMSVLRTSTDGDARAKAMARLEEPRRHGGGDSAQDEVLKLLSTAATDDPSPQCRRAAIQALGHFQDPRAIIALQSAYGTADQLAPEVAFMIRCQSLNALGETKNPQAVEFLVGVAKRPIASEITERERGQARDVRLAAVRSLKNFPGSTPAAEAVAAIARNDKDVALRDRAKETYETVTGHPPTFAPPGPPAAPTPNPIQPVGHIAP